MKQNSHPILSITIPSYNGEKVISQTINSFLPSLISDKVEIVICDDCSADGTAKVVEEYSKNFKNIHLFQNDSNLGMDGNFDKSISHAKGEYIWLCGQDDIFEEGAISKVLEVIEKNPEIDFIYVNYGQYSHDLSEMILEKMLKINEDILCKNHEEFLSITTLFELPTFLPAFVMRKKLWDSVEKTKFYGTNYVQIGVLFSLLTKLKIFLIAHPYIKGRIPNDGWQKSPIRCLDIFTGNLEVITHFYKNSPNLIPQKMYENYAALLKKMIFNSLKECRINGASPTKKVKNRLKIFFARKDRFYLFLMFLLPKKYMEQLLTKISQ